MISLQRWVASLLFVSVFLVGAAPAQAQSSTSQNGWEIEGYGGFVVPSGSGDGVATLPPAGAPIATSSPIFPSRRVPSWFFGDGALLLNQVNGQFGIADLIEPLDDALGGTALSTGSGFAGGVRVRRSLSPRFAAEVSLDFFPGAADLSEDLIAASETTRASFAPAFQGLLSTGPFTDIAVGATSLAGGSSLELAVTGTLVYQLGQAGGFVPYLTFGGGAITGAGDGASATLEGRYQFRILGQVPIDETDRATVRVQGRTVFTGVGGAGLRREVTNRWGFRIDGRVFVSPHATRVLIDAQPTVAPGSPADFVESFTTPSIQFSNDPSTGRESSLGDLPLQSFETFVADGLQVRVLVTAGIFVRF